MRVFITGGTGFLGAYILRALLKDGRYSLLANYRDSSRFDLVEDIKDRVEWINIELDDIIGLRELISTCDAIIHSAGLVAFGKRNYHRLSKVNIELTSNLVDLALEKEGLRFIYISSVSALDRPRPDGSMLDEAAVWTQEPPYSYYALSKYLGEREVWRGFAEGLDGVIVSPSMILGNGRWDEGMTRLIAEVDKGYRYYPVGSNAVVDVRDVASIVLLLLERGDIVGRRFICSGTNITLRDLSQSIAHKLHKKPPSVGLRTIEGRIIIFLLKGISKIAPGLLPMSMEELDISNMSFAYDNSQSIERLDMLYRSLEETLDYTIDAYRSQGGNFSNQ